MAIEAEKRTLAEVIRERRRQLNLTQEEVARRLMISTSLVGHLESGRRRPSQKMIVRLADVLGLDRREMVLLGSQHAEPWTRTDPGKARSSAWEDFRRDEEFRHLHGISDDEMEMLSRVALLGDVQSPRDFIYILNTVRHAVGR